MITQLQLSYFRGVKERTLAFNPGQNRIEGPNESGKSTVAEAFAFALYGVDVGGGKNPDHLIHHGQDTTTVALSTDKAVFVRKKKRGQTSTVELQRPGFPAIKMTQTELTALLGMDYDLAASAIFVGYFMGLTPERRIAVINEAVKIDRKALLTSHLSNVEIPWKLIKLVNTKVDAEAVARERRALQNLYSANQGAIRELDAVLSNSDTNVSPEEATKLEDLLMQLQGKVDLYSAYEVQARDFQYAHSLHQTAVTAYEWNLAHFKKLNAELAALGGAPNYREKEWEDKLAHLTSELNSARMQYKQKPLAPVLKEHLSDQSCPRCGQMVSDKLKASILAEREAKLIEFNQLEREIEDHNQAVQNTVEMLESQAKRIAQESSDLKSEHAVWMERTISIRNQLKTLNPIAPNVAPVAPLSPWPIEEAENNKKYLFITSGRIQAAKIFIEKSASNRAKLGTLGQSSADLAIQIQSLAAVEGVLKALPEVELLETIEKIQLPGVNVKIEEGQLQISVGDIPYHSLSSGRRMKTDFLWSRCIQSLLKTPPGFYFCDNADLVDSFKGFLPEGSQVFLASVKSNLTELQVVSL